MFLDFSFILWVFMTYGTLTQGQGVQLQPGTVVNSALYDEYLKRNGIVPPTAPAIAPTRPIRKGR